MYTFRKHLTFIPASLEGHKPPERMFAALVPRKRQGTHRAEVLGQYRTGQGGAGRREGLMHLAVLRGHFLSKSVEAFYVPGLCPLSFLSD